MNLDNYLYGECHIFAMALNMELGYKIELAIDSHDLETGGEVLIHAYCVDGNKAIDANGVKYKDDILDDYDYSEEYFKIATLKELESYIANGFLHAPIEGQINELRQYIRNSGRYARNTEHSSDKTCSTSEHRYFSAQ